MRNITSIIIATLFLNGNFIISNFAFILCPKGTLTTGY